MSNRINKKLGKYISYKLKLIGVTHNDIASSSNLSTSIITHILNGRKRSSRGEKAIAKALGYDDFESLVEEAEAMISKETNLNK